MCKKHKEIIQEWWRNTLEITNNYEEFDERIYWFIQDTLRNEEKKNGKIRKPNEWDKNNKYFGHSFRNKQKYCQQINENILHIIKAVHLSEKFRDLVVSGGDPIRGKFFKEL